MSSITREHPIMKMGAYIQREKPNWCLTRKKSKSLSSTYQALIGFPLLDACIHLYIECSQVALVARCLPSFYIRRWPSENVVFDEWSQWTSVHGIQMEGIAAIATAIVVLEAVSWDIFSFEVFFGYFQNNVVKIKLIISNK